MRVFRTRVKCNYACETIRLIFSDKKKKSKIQLMYLFFYFIMETNFYYSKEIHLYRHCNKTASHLTSEISFFIILNTHMIMIKVGGMYGPMSNLRNKTLTKSSSAFF